MQVIKKDEDEGGVLEFGTEVVNAADGSIAALLGASPGASTAVSIMIDLLNRCFADKMKTADWQDKIQKMIPSYRKSLADNETFSKESGKRTAAALELANEKETAIIGAV